MADRDPLVLGADPGTLVAGYGILRLEDASYIDCGVLKPTYPKADPWERYTELADDYGKLIDEYKPVLLAVEKAHVRLKMVNTRGVARPVVAGACLLVAEARGALLYVAQSKGVEVVQYDPSRWRKLAFGVGGLDKRQVQKRVRREFNFVLGPEFDAADALGLAIAAVRAREWGVEG